MKDRSASRLANLVLLLIAVVMSLGIIMSGIQASHARNLLLIVNLFFGYCSSSHILSLLYSRGRSRVLSQFH